MQHFMQLVHVFTIKNPLVSSSPPPKKPLPRKVCTLSIPPMSPTQQLDIMHRQEEKMNALEVEPTERDLKASISEISNGLVI